MTAFYTSTIRHKSTMIYTCLFLLC